MDEKGLDGFPSLILISLSGPSTMKGGCLQISCVEIIQVVWNLVHRSCSLA